MKTYKGRRTDPEQTTLSDVIVTVEEAKKKSPLKHQVYHSPTGLNWGYGGSGPADLARSILWDYLGKEPQMPLYQEFKWKFVAAWEEEWQVTSAEIESWIKQTFGKDYFNYLTKTDQSDPRD